LIRTKNVDLNKGRISSTPLPPAQEFAMPLPWEAINYVSGGLTLIAFIAAILAWAYRHRLKTDLGIILTLPEGERLSFILARYANILPNESSGLTKEQRLKYIELYLYHAISRYKVLAIVIVCCAVLTSIVAVAAITHSTKLAKAEASLQSEKGNRSPYGKQLRSGLVGPMSN
jgi:hypothetical protein